MKTRFFAVPILPTVVCGVAFLSSFLQAEDEDLTTGKPPEPLVLQKPNFTGPGLIHWLGDPLQHTWLPTEFQWVNDGSRMFTGSIADGARILVWSASEGGTKIQLAGSFPLRPGTVSPDGKWIAGTQRIGVWGQPGSHDAFAVYHADSLQGVWQSDSQDFLNLQQVIFTRDSKYLVAAGFIPNGFQVSVIDPATGRRIKKITHHEEPRQPGPDTFVVPKHYDIAVGKDCVLLPPIFDEKGCIQRLDLRTLETTPVTDPKPEGWDPARLTLSGDDRWLVLATYGGLEVLERTATQYVQRFTASTNAEIDAYGTIWGDRFTRLTFSPDNKLLVVSTTKKFKVIRLEDQQVIQSSNSQNMAGVFSPDGLTYWNADPAFRAFDTSTWTARPNASFGAEPPTDILHFSPQGYRLLLGNGAAAEVWEINGSQPTFSLRPPQGSRLSSFLWGATAQDAYGSSPESYVHWKIPAQAGGTTTENVVGEPLFEMPAYWQAMSPEDKKKHYPLISGYDPNSGAFLLSMALMRDITELRYLSRPAVVRHFKGQVGEKVPVLKAYFSADGKEFFFNKGGYIDLVSGQITNISGNSPEATVCGFNLETNVLREAQGPKTTGHLMGSDRKNHRLVVMGRDSGITLLDETSLKPITTLFPPSPYYWAGPGCLSPDGHWFFCHIDSFSPREGRTHRFALVDLQAGKIAALIPPTDGDVVTCDFSADSSFLAIGYASGPVSIWRVSAMITTPAPRMRLADHVVIPDATPRLPLPEWNRWKTGSPEPFTLSSGGTWSLDQAGGLTGSQSANFHVGEWFVNGQRLQSSGQKFHNENQRASILSVNTEMQDAGGQLRLHREIRVERYDRVSYVDTWENTGSTPLNIKIGCVWGLGGDLPTLRNEDGSNVAIKGDVLTVAAPLEQVGAELPSPDGGDKRICLCLSSPNAPQRPVLRWDATKHAVVSEWTLQLAPFERRAIYQQMIQFASSSPLPALFAASQQFGASTLRPGILGSLVNFAVQPDEQAVQASRNNVMGLQPDGSQKDGLGFGWLLHGRFQGANSELGFDRALALAVNRGSVLFPHEGDVHIRGRQAVEEGEVGSANASLLVQRRSVLSKEEGSFAVHDTFSNDTQQTITLPVDLLLKSRTKIIGALSSTGQRLDLSKPYTAQDGSGMIAVALEGDSRPAMVIAFGSATSKLPGTVSFPDEKTVLIHYNLSLNPGEKVALAHLAAARPLTAFAKPTDIFSDIKPPMTQDAFQDADLTPAANW